MATTGVSPAGAGYVVVENQDSMSTRWGSIEWCDFRAVANPGYDFAHWVVEWSTRAGGVVSTNQSDYNPLESVTTGGSWFDRYSGAQYVSAVTAYFVSQSGTTYTVTVAASPSGGGTVYGGGSYADGIVCTLTATRASGWRFVRWEGPNGAVVTTPQHQFAVHANQSWTALFAQLTGQILHGSSGTILHGAGGSILHDA